MKSILSSASAVCLLAVFAAAPYAKAEMSVASFPDKVIISATDSRTIAFIAAENGKRVQGATVSLSLAGAGGKLSASSCQTDESGQCHVGYTAPREPGKGKIEVLVSSAGTEKGSASVDLEVVPVPNMEDSGWQCGKDSAVFAKIGQEISCETTCSLAKDCAGSPCRAGSGKYCYSAAEACACAAADDAKGRVKGATAHASASADGCDPHSWHYCNPLRGTVESLSEAGIKSIQALLGLIGTIALLLLIIAGIMYITAAGNEEKIKQAKKIITGTIIGLGIALVAYSLLVTVSEILEVKGR